MKYLKKGLSILLKTVKIILIVILMVFVATSVTLVYDFENPTPFSGPDIYNPYKNFDSTNPDWKKANLHVHTRVEGIFNECEYWPIDVYKYHEKLGYDIVTFSNHNELTEHPFDNDLQVNVYEHGYNLFKFHKLVFGSKDVNSFDNLLPLFASQKQFQIDILSKESDIVVFNHPLRTIGLSKSQMEKISGYDLIELDSGKDTENEYWDWALSAGHYSFGIANDDLHFPDRSDKIARRCNFLYTPSAKYEDIKNTLLCGCFYSMRIPDYGDGDWNIKIQRNKMLPNIKDIGCKGDSIFAVFSQNADSIKVIGENHTLLAKALNSSTISYKVRREDKYARFTAYFPDGEVIYTNPFARYDSSVSNMPGKAQTYSVNMLLTILFNLTLLVIFAGLSIILYKIILKIRDENRFSKQA